MASTEERQNPDLEEERSDSPGGARSPRPHSRGPMGRVKKVIFGILAGLGLAVFLLYLYLFLTA